jgi:hypothetical protein
MWLIDTEKTSYTKKTPLCANLHFLDNNTLSTTSVIYYAIFNPNAAISNNGHKWYTKNNILYTTVDKIGEDIYHTLYKVSDSTLILELDDGNKLYYKKTKDSKKAITNPVWK